MYTTTWCPHCTKAKSLLASKGVAGGDIHEIDVERLPGGREAMARVAHGRMTVPQIFVGGTHVGGCDDLFALERAGRLDALLG